MQLGLFSIHVFLCIVVLSLGNNNSEICTLQVAESFVKFPGFELLGVFWEQRVIKGKILLNV